LLNWKDDHTQLEEDAVGELDELELAVGRGGALVEEGKFTQLEDQYYTTGRSNTHMADQINKTGT
jgi:hypothetical protein